ncbi:MAG: NfeD family protein [Luteolibacter sp.]
MTLIILLFAIGIFLLAAEVMIPGGILGLAGGVLLFTGCIVSFVQLGTTEGLIAIGISLIAAFIVFYIQFRILPKTRFGKRFFLRREISGSSTALGNDARDLIGKTAQSVTVLSPSGYVSIDGKRYEAVSQSGQIAPGTPLEVIAANHFQLTVRTKS